MELGWVLLLLLSGVIGLAVFAARASRKAVVDRSGRKVGDMNDGLEAGSGLVMEIGSAGDCAPGTAGCADSGGGGDGGGGGGD